MDSNSEQYRKLFIGGLSYDTTEDSLRAYFEKWGNIVDCVVMRDQNTKRSRGFGFVTYDTQEALNESQANRPHVIDGKEVEAKRATPRERANEAEARMSIKKIFVGGLAHEAEEDNLRDYFSTYGSVLNVDIIKDKETGKKRGFAFVTFDDYDPVDRICMDKNHNIMGRRCDVRKALDKKDMGGAPGGRGGRGGGRGGVGGRGGGRGGYSQGGYGGGGGGYNSYSNGSGYNNGSGDSYSQGSSWGGNQGGGSWGGNQGGSWGGNQGGSWGGQSSGSGWDNQQSGGSSWGGQQGGGSWDNSQGGGSWGGNQGGSYGGSQGGYGGQRSSSGGGYSSGGGGPMKSGGNYSNRSSGPYGGGYGGGYNNRR